MNDIIYKSNVEQVVDDIKHHIDQIRREDNGIEADCQEFETALAVNVKLFTGETKDRVFIMRKQLNEMRLYLDLVLKPLTTVSLIPSSEAQGSAALTGSAA